MSEALTISAAPDRREVPDRATLDLDVVRADQRAQPRENLNTELTEAYAQDMGEGAEFPPLIVFFDGATYWLADGFHRRYAALSIGLAELPCEIRQGDLRDAILHSCAANSSHGQRRSNADKRRAVTRLLEDEEWRQWSDSAIARQCRVDHKTVAKMRAEMQPHPGNSQDTPRKVQRGDSTYEMNTAGLKANGHNKRNTINVPEGMTPEEMCRKGMAMEAEGMSADDVARALFTAAHTYRAMRDIVMLHDRDDLREADAAMVAEALSFMNETKRISQAHQHIRPLVERVWGVNRNSSSRAHAERRRVQMFEDSLSLLVNTCEGVAANIDIPYLNPQQIERAVRELKQAEKKLKEIRGQIERTGT